MHKTDHGLDLRKIIPFLCMVYYNVVGDKDYIDVITFL
jgi:hypothetical protein